MYYSGEIEINRRKLEQLKKDLQELYFNYNNSSESRAEKVKSRLYKKLIDRKLEEIRTFQDGVIKSTLKDFKF